MTRVQSAELTNLIRFAGYHGDLESFVELATSNPIDVEAARRAYESGEQARAVGVICKCVACALAKAGK